MSKPVSTIFELPAHLEKITPQLISKSQKNTISVIIEKAKSGEYGPSSKLKEREVVLKSQLALLLPFTEEIINTIDQNGIE